MIIRHSKYIILILFGTESIMLPPVGCSLTTSDFQSIGSALVIVPEGESTLTASFVRADFSKYF